MLGAIIGDIVGSVYEWNNIKTKDFPLFRDGCFFTDDTVMTIAVADAIMQGGTTSDDFIDSMKKWGRLYPNADYGGSFRNWLFSSSREPYNSWGNGSAMRASPCGWFVPTYQFMGDGFDEVLNLAQRSAEVTHNHPEGIKGAQATALAVFYMRHGRLHGDVDSYKALLRRDFGGGDSSLMKLFDYNLNRTLDEIRPAYKFDESCQGTVPEAIIAFLESTDFEDAIRNAISLGGDSDTLAAITGSIAEAAYGIPNAIACKALDYLDAQLREVYERWCAYCEST